MKTHKASMTSQLAKFPNDEKWNKILKKDGYNPDQTAELINFTSITHGKCEDRALTAVQVIADKQGYAERIRFKMREFLELYGCSQKEDGSFVSGNEVQQAIQALLNLSKTYDLKWLKPKGKNKYVIAHMHGGLVIFYSQTPKGVPGQEGSDLTYNQTSGIIENEHSLVSLQLSDILTYDIDMSFMLIRNDMYKEIDQYYRDAGRAKPKQYNKYVPNFIQWVMLNDFNPVRVSREKLIERVGMKRLVRQRQQGRIDEHLKDCFNVAVALNYVSKIEDDASQGDVIYTFYLNPERCSRYAAKNKRLEKTPTENKKNRA